jgi:hypothetical protein
MEFLAAKTLDANLDANWDTPWFKIFTAESS